MPLFDTDAAFAYYAEHIHRQARFDLLEEHNFEIAGSIPSVDWELLGAILTGDDRKIGYGSDLKDHEVKSAVEGSSFEYQYHRHGGLAKLDEDKNVDHVFISYAPDYKRLTVRLVDRTKLSPTFESWRDGLIQNYQGTAPRQRYRKSISFGTVVREGEIILRVENNQLIQAQEELPATVTSPAPEPPE